MASLRPWPLESLCLQGCGHVHASTPSALLCAARMYADLFISGLYPLTTCRPWWWTPSLTPGWTTASCTRWRAARYACLLTCRSKPCCCSTLFSNHLQCRCSWHIHQQQRVHDARRIKGASPHAWLQVRKDLLSARWWERATELRDILMPILLMLRKVCASKSAAHVAMGFCSSAAGRQQMNVHT